MKRDKYRIEDPFRDFIRESRKRRLLRRAMALLSAVVLLLTMNRLELSASTMTADDFCSIEEHIHTDACYVEALSCSLDEADPVTETRHVFVCDFKPHKHTKVCRDNEGNVACGYVEGEYYHRHNSWCCDGSGKLVCGLEEKKPHEHTSKCWRKEKTLICGLEEAEGHTHTEACWCERSELSCGREKSEGHIHTDACYEERSELACSLEESVGHEHGASCYESVLLCEQEESEEHSHGRSCYTDKLVCKKSEGEGAHAHDASCYRREKVLICKKDEGEGAHEHDESCFTLTRELICGHDESEGHTHSDACYEMERILACGEDMAENVAKKMKLESVQLHVHDPNTCFTTVTRRIDGKNVEVQWAKCGYMEVQTHESSDACWQEETVVVSEGHRHTADCYDKVLICEKPEHVHGVDCVFSNRTETEPEGGVEPVPGEKAETTGGEEPEEIKPGTSDNEREDTDSEAGEDGETAEIENGEKAETEDHEDGEGPDETGLEDTKDGEAAELEDVEEGEAEDPEETEPNDGEEPDETDPEGSEGEETAETEDGEKAEAEDPENAEPEDGEEHDETSPEDAEKVQSATPEAPAPIEAAFDFRETGSPLLLRTLIARLRPEPAASVAEAAEGAAGKETREDTAGETGLTIRSWDGELLSVMEVDGDWAISPLCRFESAVLLAAEGAHDYVLSFSNEVPPYVESVSAGVAVISPVAGVLPGDAAARGDVLRGGDADEARETVEEAAKSEPEVTAASLFRGAKAAKALRGTKAAKPAELYGSSDGVFERSEVRYVAFEIGLENVDPAEYPEGFKVSVALPEALKGRDFQLFHIHEYTDGVREVTEIPVPAFAGEGERSISSFDFVTPNFSSFVVRYTVDFRWEDGQAVYEYSLPGGGAATLSGLFAALGISANAADAETVSFSSPELVWVGRAEDGTTVGALKDRFGFDCLYSAALTEAQIAQIDSLRVEAGDWALIGLRPFASKEELTVGLKSGERITISVTDLQGLDENETTDLQDLLTRVTVTGASLVDGKYVVHPGQPYSLILTFKETPQYQIDSDATLVYHVPDGVTLPADSTDPISVNIVSGGRTYEVRGSVTANTDGTILLKFDTSDPNFVYLEDATNVGIRITVNAEFTESVQRTKWSSKVERDIILDTTDDSDVFVTKTGVFDEQTGKFSYTIQVTAQGEPQNVNVKDVISGNALIFNNDIAVSGYSGHYSSAGVSNGFDYTFDSMTDGQVITITYTASINPAQAENGTITADQTKNTVTAQKEGGDPHIAEYSRGIDLIGLRKGDGAPTGLAVDRNRIYSWRIDYNPMALASVVGNIVTDSITPESQSYMHYYGDVRVNVYDAAGTLVGETSFTPSDSFWSYKIPEMPGGDKGAYHYVFEYETIVDQTAVDQQSSTLTLWNRVSDDGKTDLGAITVSPSEETSITKAVESANPQEVSWVSHIHVPSGGLSTAVVKDTVPSISAHRIGLQDYSTQHFDEYVEGSLQVNGLLPGEAYSVSYAPDEFTLHALTITFYQNPEKTIPGLRSTPGGHDITIRLKTSVDQDWLQYGFEHPEIWDASHHKNTIEIGSQMAFAEATFVEPGIKKNGFDNVKPRHYRYDIVLSDVTHSPIVIDDVFNTSLLEVATDIPPENPWRFKIYGGEGIVNQSNGETNVNFSVTPTGIRITADDVPMKENGEYYPYYRISYTLMLKDGVDLEDLAAENEGEFELTNTATWEGREASYTFTTKYDFLDKELLQGPTSTSRRVQYRITFNKAKAELNRGQDMTLTDTLNENLSIDYTSINIVTDPPEVEVPYTLRGEGSKTVATYTIPDATKVVVTYDATVIGNGSVHLENVAEIKGIKETVTEEATIEIAGEVDGATADLKVVKVDGYNAANKLAGVSFRLYSADLTEEEKHYNLSLSPSSPPVYEMTLTSDENGVIHIDGTKMKIYFGVKYYLEEIEAPDGYLNLSFPYQFTLVDDADLVDYPNFVYLYSDSFQIKNWPLEGLVVEKRVEGGEESDRTRDFTFRVSILGEDGTVDESVNETYGDMAFTNGVAEFTLKDGEQLSASDMPQDTKFLVEEIDAEDYTVSWTIGETAGEGNRCKGETSVEYTHVVFTNAKEEQVYTLPSTGGPGMGRYWFPGLLLIAVAGVLLLARRQAYVGKR